MRTMTTAATPSLRDPHLLSDETLLIRYRDDGDQAAFAELMRRYEHELFYYLCRYLHDATLAEEVFQSAFLRLHLHREHFRAGHRVRPWLYTIATHLAIDALRRAGRHRATSLDVEHGDDATLVDLLVGHTADPAARLEQQEERQSLLAAVAALPRRLSEAINLVYFAGLKYGDAARRLGIPLGTLKSRLHESLIALKRTLVRRSNANDS